jgi:hypothetical protein
MYSAKGTNFIPHTAYLANQCFLSILVIRNAESIGIEISIVPIIVGMNAIQPLMRNYRMYWKRNTDSTHHWWNVFHRSYIKQVYRNAEHWRRPVGSVRSC